MTNDKWPRDALGLDWIRELSDPMDKIRRQLRPVNSLAEVRGQMMGAGRYAHLASMSEQIKAFMHPHTEAVSAARQWAEQNSVVKLAQEQYLPALSRISQFAEQDAWARKWQEQLAPALAKVSQIKEFLEPQLARTALDAWKAIEQAQLKDWTKVFGDFSRYLEDLPEQLRYQLVILMERGWCLDPEMPHVWVRNLVEAFEEGEEAETQEWIAHHFRERLDEIETELIEQHPSRAAVLSDAFQAHREGRYHLSIPVFLAQADGMTYERKSRQLYSKTPGIGLSSLIEELPEDDLIAIYMSVFMLNTPLTKNTKHLPSGFDGLNRHAVFHGTDPNYGTEINSLRAISVLNLASYVLTVENGEHA